MPRRPVSLFAALLVAGILGGCPDPKGPNGPTAPKVPEPKAFMAPRLTAAVPGLHQLSYFKENS